MQLNRFTKRRKKELITFDVQSISMKRLIFIFTLSAIVWAGQAQSDKQLLKYIKKSVTYLADDDLEGRRTGTVGEKKANSYIIHEFGKNGLSPIFKYENGTELFVQPF